MRKTQHFKVMAEPLGSRFDNCSERARLTVEADRGGEHVLAHVCVKGVTYTMPLGPMLDGVRGRAPRPPRERGTMEVRVRGEFGKQAQATVTLIEDGAQGQVRVRPYRSTEERTATLAAICHRVILRHAEHVLGTSFAPRRRRF